MTPLNLTYRSRLPDPAGPRRLDGDLRPAVVLVHGWLGNEHVMWAFEKALPPAAAVFSPRAPYAVEAGFGWSAERADSASFSQGLAALKDFVAGLPAAYPVDPRRIVLVGFSQGAALSAALALAAPELIRGAALLAGFLPPSAQPWAAPGRLAGKPVFMAHGDRDETVSVAAARQAREALAGAGALVTYGEYPIGHKLSAQGMRDLTAWLEAHV